MRVFFSILLFLVLLPVQLVFAQEADSLFETAKELRRSAEYEKSNRVLKSAFPLYLEKKDTLQWAFARKMLANNYEKQGRVLEGIRILNSLDSMQFTKPLEFEAELKNDLGVAKDIIEDYDNSRNLFNKALDLAYRLNDSTLIAHVSNNIALSFYRSRDYEQAANQILKTIELKNRLDDELSLTYTFNLAYLTFSKLGMYDSAEKFIKRKISIAEAYQNEYLMDIGYHNLASLYRKKGIFDQAIIYYQKSLELTRKLGNPFEITQTLLNIGNLYFDAGRLETAYDYFAESLELNRQTGRPGAIYNSIKALAKYYEAKGNYAKARELLAEGLALQDPDNPSSNYGSALFALADLDNKRGNPDAAFEYAQKGLQWIQENNLNSMLASSYRLMGELEHSAGNLKQSLDYYRRAYRASENKLPGDKVWYLIDLSRAYHRVGHDSAFTLAAKAFKLIEDSRLSIAESELKAGIFSRYVSFYNDVAEWYITGKKNPQKAFELAEAGKSRALIDELAEARDRIYAELDPSTMVKKKAKEKEIDDLFAKLEEAQTKGEKDQIQRQLNMAELEYQSFLSTLKNQHTGWQHFEYPGTVDAAEAINLAGQHTTIVEYAFSGKNLLIFTITPSGISANVIEAQTGTAISTQIQTLVENYRNLIVNKAPQDQLEHASNKLVDLLLAPVLPRLKSTENLLIVPAQSLAYLPFEALIYEDRYLIETYTIKYLPSVSMYEFIRDPHRPTQRDLFAVAGTGFVDATLTSATRSQAAFASLPSALIEVDSVSAKFENAVALKDDEVSEAALKSYELDDFKYLHFATHGDINERAPSQSGLLLSRETDTETLFGEDGFLNSKEISTLQLNSDMVVLSACNTGIGKIVNGEGLLGLQRSFFTAGTSSVLVSLWNVYDRSTADFMNSFYKTFTSLKKDEYGIWEKTLKWFGFYEAPLFDYKARALRTTKMAFIDHPYYHHPVYWAPFVLLGK